MKLLATTLALVSAVAAAPHYTFPKLSGTTDWAVVRKTENFQHNGPVTDVNSAAIRCYELAGSRASTSTQSVTAGSQITFTVQPNIFHPGPLSGWMAKVPSGQSISSWDGSGAVWFKTFQELPLANTPAGQGLQFPSMNAGTVSFTIPACIANGDYLFRVEHNALHSASALNGAQFYISCAQIKVTGGSGSKTPSGLVSFPGVYKNTDPGILVNIYTAKTYTPAGPAVFTC